VELVLYLVGDAGSPAPGFEPVLAAVARDAARVPDRSVVLFLGDNVYPRGLPDSRHPRRAESERRLDAQLAVLRETGARGFFVLGNHDWDSGLEGVVQQERFIGAADDGRATLLPRAGCPGPAVVDVTESVRLVFLDTQWWFPPRIRPAPERIPCDPSREGTVIDSLRGALASAGGRLAIVAGHHPIESGGPHGGHFPWTAHVFPLRRLAPWLWLPIPVLGSIYPMARMSGVKSQDLSSSAYGALRDSLRGVFEAYRPLAYVAGHDHNLQVIRDERAGNLLVSGAGTYEHTSRASRADGSRYASSASGFMRLEVLHGGRVRIAVLEVDERGEATEAFSGWLD
jgi:hypothetical protein